MNVYILHIKFEVRSFTRSWDNRWVLKNYGLSRDVPTLPLLQNLMDFCSDGPRECTAHIWCPYSFTRSWDNSGNLKTLGSPWIRRSRSSKVIHFGTNRKCVCALLFVRDSNLGPILHCFGDITFFCAPGWPHPYSTLILGVFPLHQIAHVGVSPHMSLKLLAVKLFWKNSNLYDHGS